MTTRKTSTATRGFKRRTDGRGMPYRLVDPTPGPYPGHGPILYRRFETPEQCAFRRFPISREPAPP